MNLLPPLKDWSVTTGKSLIELYDEYERFAAPMAFLGGVTYDTLTITRIDRLFENAIILLYLLLLGAAIIAYGRLERGELRWNLVKKYEDYVHLVIQFLMGGLLSVYTIFYFRSTTLSPSVLFVVFLAALLLANEFLAHRLLNLNLLVMMYFFVWLSFCVFFVPVMIGHMGDWVFYGSSLISLVPGVGLLYFLYYPDWYQNLGNLLKHFGCMIGLALVILLLYSQNLIPPIPLSMEEGGAYYNVTKSNNTYHLTYDRPGYYEWFRSSADPVYWSPGEQVYCFVSIFAPTDFNATVRHKWQWYRGEDSTWVTTDDLAYEITGGRRGGYRGYTVKSSVRPGTWRVTILTGNDRVLGRVQFKILRKPEGKTLDLITRDV